jgi:hypothetical protein
MTNNELIAGLEAILKDLDARYDELQTKMRELGSAAAEVNQLRVPLADLINKAKTNP